jgi:hypothetical protein
MHQFQDKRTGTAKRLPLGISYATDFATHDAQLMQNFRAGHVHPDHAGTVAAPPALVDIAFDLALAATGHRKYDTAAAARGGSISKPPLAGDNMPPGFTQSARYTSCTGYYYTAPISGEKFTSLKAPAWAHHGPSGEARRAFDEAKEAAKEAARPAREAAREAAFASTSIATGDVMRCGRAICQRTQNHTGPPWTHQRGKRRRIYCTSCGKRGNASKRVVVVV